jgi:hypothetical protein
LLAGYGTVSHSYYPQQLRTREQQSQEPQVQPTERFEIHFGQDGRSV